MRLWLAVLFALCLPVTLWAQPAPLVGTTIKATSTADSALCVGCPTPTLVPAANSGAKIATITLEQYAAPSVTTNKLYSIAGAVYFNGAALATGGTIIGTTNTIGLFTGPTAIGNSIITQNAGATTVTVTGILNVNGAVIGTSYTGSGSGLTNVPTTGITGNFVATVGSGTGITSSVTTGNAAATVISLNNTAVTPNSYGTTTGASFTVDQQGRLTTAANATITSLGTVTTGVWNAGALTTSGVLNVNNTGVSSFTGSVNGLLETDWANASTGTGAGVLLQLVAGAADAAVRLNSSGFTTSGFNVQGALVLQAGHAGGISIIAQSASGAIRGYTGGTTQRFQYDASGNYILGSGTNITDAVATPTISSGFGAGATVTGKSYAFVINVGTTPGTTGLINLNATYANAAVCTASFATVGLAVGITIHPQSTTSTVPITFSVAPPNNALVNVLCRGF
jgi:hypothetical protein